MLDKWNALPRQAKIAAGVAAAVVLVLALRGCGRSARGQGAPTVRRVTAARQPLKVTKTATGEVRPQNRVEVKPPIAGRIEEVLVREGERVTQGQVMAWMSSSERAALLDAAQAQGEAAVAKWQEAYKAAPLIAPLDGTLIVRAVEPGQTITTADPVVVIADRLIVQAQVDETDIREIAVGQPATISLDAYPDELVPARVDHVAYEATTVNNVTIYEVDVVPDTVPEMMRSGMTATVTFHVLSKPEALVVPTEAVERTPAGATVRVPKKGARLGEPRAVETGATDGKSIEILSGVTEGEVVLIQGAAARRNERGAPRSPFSPMGARRSGDRPQR